MEVLEAIFTRRSIRKYKPDPVSEELLDRLIRAAMMAPSARDSQPWHFVVLTERALLDKVPEINPNAWMARQAPAGILVCGDMSLEMSQAGYWVVDCAAAVQNMLLAAHGLGLGAVWTGVYPRQQRMEGFRNLLGLPEGIMPHSLVLVGYPDEKPPHPDRYKPERIHWNGW